MNFQIIPVRRVNRKKIKQNYLNELESQIKSLNKEILDLKNLIAIYKKDNESQITLNNKLQAENNILKDNKIISEFKIIQIEKFHEENHRKELEISQKQIESLKNKHEKEELIKKKQNLTLIQEQKKLKNENLEHLKNISKLEQQYSDTIKMTKAKISEFEINISELSKKFNLDFNQRVLNLEQQFYKDSLDQNIKIKSLNTLNRKLLFKLTEMEIINSKLSDKNKIELAEVVEALQNKNYELTVANNNLRDEKKELVIEKMKIIDLEKQEFILLQAKLNELKKQNLKDKEQRIIQNKTITQSSKNDFYKKKILNLVFQLLNPIRYDHNLS